ncbi:MAG: alpha/beta hydrolase family protein [Bulleidia sp.]
MKYRTPEMHEPINEETDAYRETYAEIPLDGYLMPAITCIPKGKVNGAAVMLHGTGSSKNEAGNGYRIAAPILAEKYGIATIRIDFPGYGDSDADPALYDFDEAVRNAVAAKNYLIKQVGDGVKTGVMGWSQGGTDAMLAAGKTGEFDSVVLWAGAPDLSGMLSDEAYETAEKQGYFMMQFDFRDPAAVSLQWCHDVRNTDVMKVFSHYSGPVLAIAGEEDTVVDPAWAQKIVDQSSDAASQVCFIPGMDHAFNVFSEEDFHSLHEAAGRTGEFFKKTLGN